MRVLLDTNVIVFAALEPERLDRSTELLRQSERLISAASIWELAIKQSIGKLDLHMSVASWMAEALDELAATPVSVDPADAAAVEFFPRSTATRSTGCWAQAQRLGATLVTTDRVLAAYGGFVRVV